MPAGGRAGREQRLPRRPGTRPGDRPTNRRASDRSGEFRPNKRSAVGRRRRRAAVAATVRPADAACRGRWWRRRPRPVAGPAGMGGRPPLPPISPARPWLERVTALKRREADAVGHAYEPDALLDEYEPGIDRPRPGTTLRHSQRGIIRSIRAGWRRRGGRTRPLRGGTTRWNGSAPRRTAAVAAVGFDFPPRPARRHDAPVFAVIGRGDCRITTRYNPHDFGDAFFSTLHEAGHGLYEQALDPSAAGLPVGEPPSLEAHGLAGPAVGERGRPAARSFWAAFLPAGAAGLPRGAGRRRPGGISFRRQRRRAVADPGARRRGDSRPAHPGTSVPSWSGRHDQRRSVR